MFASEVFDIPLFRNIEPTLLQKLLECFQSRTAHYKKDCVIFTCGSLQQEFGVVLTGSVRLESNDLWGNRSLIGIAEKGMLFAEAYTLPRPCPLPVDAVANEECSVLFLRSDKLMTPCSNACPCHVQLLKNMMLLSTQKSVALSERMLDCSPKTIRGRLMRYFTREVARQGSNKLVLGFDRQQLADYLNLDRSALSKELSKMRSEGLLRYRKNEFEILQIAQRE